MKRFASTLLYLLVGLPLALSSLLALSLRPWAFDASFYKKALMDEKLYAVLRAPESVSKVRDRIEIGGYVFSGPALAGALQAHLPEADLKATTGRAIDALVGDAAEGRLPPPLDLRPLKKAFARELLPLARTYLAALAKPGAALPSPAPLPPGTRDLSVLPSGVAPAEAEKTMAVGLGQVLASLPDELPYGEGASMSRVNQALPGGPRAVLDRLAFVGSGVTAFLLLGLGFLGGGGLAASLARTGRYLILPSTLVLAVGTLLAIPGAQLIGIVPAEAQAVLGSPFAESLRSWLSSWLGVASRSFFVVGLVGVSVGGVLVSLRRALEPSEL